MKNYLEKILKKKYTSKTEICKKLGREGWVITQFSNPGIVKDWNTYLCNNEIEKIVDFFDNNNGDVLNRILSKLDDIYIEPPYLEYYRKAKLYFKSDDYMTTAMYLVALTENRVNRLMDFKCKSYKDKFSKKGFKDQLSKVYTIERVFTKEFLILGMYPSFIEFLNRMFVDGEFNFKNGIEPSYVNRNWLLHGKCCRTIKRFECIQIFNALCSIEFAFEKSTDDLVE